MPIFSKIGGNGWITFVAVTLPISGVRRSYLDSKEICLLRHKNKKNVDPKQTVSGTRQATGPLLASSLRAGGAGAGAGGGSLVAVVVGFCFCDVSFEFGLHTPAPILSLSRVWVLWLG